MALHCDDQTAVQFRAAVFLYATSRPIDLSRRVLRTFKFSAISIVKCLLGKCMVGNIVELACTIRGPNQGARNVYTRRGVIRVRGW